MKVIGKCLLYTALLATLMACGKQNTSGTSKMWNYPNPYSTGMSPYTTSGTLSSIAVVNQIIQMNPCVTNPSLGRIPIQIPLTNFKSTVAPGDYYVGVTSYGDVAAVVGGPLGQPPVFMGYMCPRSFAQSGSGQLTNISIGANTSCAVKPINAATVMFPGGDANAAAYFRWLDGGTSQKSKFAGLCP